MPYCTKCGSKVTDEMLYCPECGIKLIIPTAGSKNNKSPDYATDAEVNKREDIARGGIRKSKLYKQWVKYAGLSAEEVPSMRVSRYMPVREEKRARHPHLFYILLGVGILVCIGLIILLAKIW